MEAEGSAILEYTPFLGVTDKMAEASSTQVTKGITGCNMSDICLPLETVDIGKLQKMTTEEKYSEVFRNKEDYGRVMMMSTTGHVLLKHENSRIAGHCMDCL